MTGTTTGGAATTALREFTRPYDTAALDAAVDTDGVAVLRGAITPELRARVSADVDDYLRRTPEHPLGPRERSITPRFLGHRTLRILGLAAKLPSGGDAISTPDVLAWARRTLGPSCSEITLSAAEVIEIHPGQGMQMPHRDSDLWVHMPRGAAPIAVNAMVALTRFTPENGATMVVPGSHRWEDGRWPGVDDLVQVALDPGDALLLRADLVHCGGANTTADEPRRALSLSYQLGWLRTFENHHLSTAGRDPAGFPPVVRSLLGFDAYDSSEAGGGVLGLVDGCPP